MKPSFNILHFSLSIFVFVILFSVSTSLVHSSSLSTDPIVYDQESITFVDNNNAVGVKWACTPPPDEGDNKFYLYSAKLSRLQESVNKAISALEIRREAWRQEMVRIGKGATVTQGNPALDGPLYLLRKMKINLATDMNGSLIDQGGLVKFFPHLKSLKVYADPAFGEVMTSVDKLLGFSFMFPPVPGARSVIFIPGAGGEPGWRGASNLLGGEANKFNVIGYTYNPTLQSSEMVSTLHSQFSKMTIPPWVLPDWSPWSSNTCDSVIVSLSMGSTLIHGAILADGLGKNNIFNDSFIVSAGFVPGAKEFFGKLKLFVPLAPIVYPPAAGIVSVMDPANPIYTTIAQNMVQIDQSTKGISYVNATKDEHIDFSDSVPSYYKVIRDLIFKGMNTKKIDIRTGLQSPFAKKIDVDPPNLYVYNNGKKGINNPHINLLYAPEVNQEVLGGSIVAVNQSSFLSRLNKTLGDMFTFSPTSENLAQVSRSSVTGNEPDLFDVAQSFLGSSDQNECDALAEGLADDAMSRGGNVVIHAYMLKTYTNQRNQASTCTFSTVINATVAKLAKASLDLGIGENISSKYLLSLLPPIPPTGTLSCDSITSSNVRLKYSYTNATNPALFRTSLLKTFVTGNGNGSYKDEDLSASSYTYSLRNGTSSTSPMLATVTCTVPVPVTSPKLISLSPTSIPIEIGYSTILNIKGSNFSLSGNTIQLTRVTNNGVYYVRNQWSAGAGTRISFIFPSDIPAGAYSVKVSGQNSNYSNALSLNVTGPPSSAVTVPTSVDTSVCPVGLICTKQGTTQTIKTASSTYNPSPSPSTTPSTGPSTSSSPSTSPSPSVSSSPSPSSSVHADASVNHNFIATVFYSIGDMLDSVF